MTNLPEITGALKHWPWSKEAVAAGYIPVLTQIGVDASARATMLVKDMADVGLNWPVRSVPAFGEVVLTHYEISDSDFGRIDDDNVKDVAKAHGSGLNWGSLVRLSKVCEIGRKFFGSKWPSRFRRQLLNAKDHLAFVEEMLWLNLWHDVSEIENEAQPFLHSGCKKRIDWRFKSCGQVINLEVKYRPKDWMRHVDGVEFNLAMPSYYYDVPPKFPVRNAGELNCVAVSSLAPIDESLRRRTEILLRENPAIDGVLIWSQSSREGSPIEVFLSESIPEFEKMFLGGDLEDYSHIGVVRHLWRNRDERRAVRADEVPAMLQELSKNRRVNPS